MPTSSITPKISLPCPAEKLIDHRAPMLLVRELISRENGKATAIAAKEDGKLFFSGENKILPEYFIEIMAQTMAAANGYDAICSGAPPRQAYIVSIITFTLRNIPKYVDNFVTQIKLSFDMGSVKIIDGQVICGLETIATAELKLWEKNDTPY